MTHRKVISVSERSEKLYEKYLMWSEGDSEEYHMGENDTIIIDTAEFDDGMEMDVKICGAMNAGAWTEAVLFNKKGQQLCFTEPSEEFLGEWSLEYGGNTYITEVKVA